MWFWQKKMNYLVSFDTVTKEEVTEKMHYLCGFERKGSSLFGHYTRAPGWDNI